ncbi:1-phosphofructokinase family hexose kinase [Planctomicrobium sp. SH668]|uniref:1-phosphofructokinase family hexose kinase n=1 Tax=Planctomicrobium sp. SH668 TaxID=3448126 RepID=UPI003F5BF8FF
MIVSAGLSPAWQQILRFDSLQIGEVNRATDACWCASGKVINIATAAATLGSDVTLLTSIGGLSGEVIRAEIEELGIRAYWTETDSATRVCTTLLDARGKTTELVENVADIELEKLAEFIDQTKIYANVASVTVLSGSLPQNAPVDTFERIISQTHKKFVLDIRGEHLKQALIHAPFLIKPNREELAATVGKSLAAEDDLLREMRRLNHEGVQWVVVSDGEQGCIVTSADHAVRLSVPNIKLINPIGCGDSLAAGIARELERHDDVIQAVRFGMAAAANNAEQLLPARLCLQRCEELVEQVKVEEVKPPRV